MVNPSAGGIGRGHGGFRARGLGHFQLQRAHFAWRRTFWASPVRTRRDSPPAKPTLEDCRRWPFRPARGGWSGGRSRSRVKGRMLRASEGNLPHDSSSEVVTRITSPSPTTARGQKRPVHAGGADQDAALRVRFIHVHELVDRDEAQNVGEGSFAKAIDERLRGHGFRARL